MTNSVKTIALIGSLEDTDAFAHHHIGGVNRRVPPVTLVPTNGRFQPSPHPVGLMMLVADWSTSAIRDQKQAIPDAIP
jgi:hypothetical protein